MGPSCSMHLLPHEPGPAPPPALLPVLGLAQCASAALTWRNMRSASPATASSSFSALLQGREASEGGGAGGTAPLGRRTIFLCAPRACAALAAPAQPSAPTHRMLAAAVPRSRSYCSARWHHSAACAAAAPAAACAASSSLRSCLTCIAGEGNGVAGGAAGIPAALVERSCACLVACLARGRPDVPTVASARTHIPTTPSLLPPKPTSSSRCISAASASTSRCRASASCAAAAAASACAWAASAPRLRSASASRPCSREVNSRSSRASRAWCRDAGGRQGGMTKRAAFGGPRRLQASCL